MEPVDEGEGYTHSHLPTEPRVPDPRAHSVQFIGNQLPITLPSQYLNSAAVVAPSQQRVVDLRGHGHINSCGQNSQVSERVRQQLKEQDRMSDRVMASRQIGDELMSLHAQQEHPSIESAGPQTPVTEPPTQYPTGPSAFQRTGFVIGAPVNHLVPRNDVVDEEQSPAYSGLTAGTESPGNSGITISLSGRSSSNTSSEGN